MVSHGVGAQATVVAVREKLRLWGMSQEQIAALEQRGKAEERVVINAPVGGDLGYRQGCRDGHHMPDHHDQDGASQSGVADGIAETQEEYGAQDSAETGQENRSGPKTVALRGLSRGGLTQ